MHIFIWKEIFIIESKMAKIRSIGIIFEMLSCRKLIGHEYAYLAEKNCECESGSTVCWINPFTWKKLTIDHNMDEKNNFLSEYFLYKIKPSSVRSRNFIVPSHTVHQENIQKISVIWYSQEKLRRHALWIWT